MLYNIQTFYLKILKILKTKKYFEKEVKICIIFKMFTILELFSLKKYYFIITKNVLKDVLVIFSI